MARLKDFFSDIFPLKNGSLNPLTYKYISRFNIVQAFLTTYSWWELLLLFGGIGVFFYGYVEQDYNIRLSGIGAIIIVGIFLIFTDRLFAGISCLSPRLIFTLLGAWLAYPLLGNAGLHSQYIHWGWFLAAGLVIFIYLIREIRESTQDNNDGVTFGRTLLVMLLIVVYTAIIGIISINETLSYKVKKGKTISTFLVEGLADSSLQFKDPHLFSTVYFSMKEEKQKEILEMYVTGSSMNFPIPADERDLIVKRHNTLKNLPPDSCGNLKTLNWTQKDFVDSSLMAFSSLSVSF